MKTTPIAKYSYPEDIDPPDGPSQLSSLARQFGVTAIPKFTSTVDRDAAFPTPSDNQMAYLTSTDLFVVYSASARVWKEFIYSQPAKAIWTPLAPYYTSHFIDYGGTTWSRVEFCKDAKGEVHFRGLAKATAAAPAGTHILSTALPVGYRPAYWMGWMAERSTHQYSRLDVSNAGMIQINEAMTSGQYLFFDMIHYFPA